MKRGKGNRSFVSSSAGSSQREQVPSGTVSEGAVRGERGMPSVSTIRSLQSRVSSILACGLMMILGAGMLTWYYTSAISRQSRAKRNAQSAASQRACRVRTGLVSRVFVGLELPVVASRERPREGSREWSAAGREVRQGLKVSSGA